ncbi:hypothetical protein [Methylomicrobium sp. Wu6]|uniref:hypothetical protein n=1 Tax=Methylomicrobium sp. Wu6 TaxID=3107928 RepID=UPI002DD69A17|nr:hypothetical protein [Methylomicrobium sp. Wu6]MEC4746936.1 hypothetical protein [Methylomicrobium sp. Wu6]
MNQNIEFLQIDEALLLQRIEQGGQTGAFLAGAFISTYRMKPLKQSLGIIANLDGDGILLLHQIIHMRHVPNWSDGQLYELEKQILKIQRGVA